MTDNTREVEEVQWQDELRQMFPPQGREDGAYFAALSQVKAFISRTLHHQLQKAREEERERIENELDKHIPPHPLSLEDSVWLKRLLNKVFQHEQGTN